MKKQLAAFDRLLKTMDELREKCPWDKAQTYESLRKLTIEETYELADAIVRKDAKGICDELGDLMLHIVFYAKIGSENKAFDITDVLQKIHEKLVFRHPHVFGKVKVNDAEEVKKNWESLKIKEGRKSILGGVPQALPAIVKANRIQEKAKGVGFDWEKKEQVWDKVKEELQELMNEAENWSEKQKKKKPGTKEKEKLEGEFGDLLFSVINAARLYEIDPELALEKTNRKFIGRFNYLEEKTIKKGKSLHTMSLAEMDKYWEKAKKWYK